MINLYQVFAKDKSWHELSSTKILIHQCIVDILMELIHALSGVYTIYQTTFHPAKNEVNLFNNAISFHLECEKS